MGVSIESIPATLRPAVIAECGQARSVEDRSWDHGEAQVLHVQGASGACVVKRHRTLDHHRREVAAYEDWVAGWSDVPRLLGHVDDPPALAISMLPGVSGLAVPPADRAVMHRQAGAFLARLHAVPMVDADIPLDEALALRTETWTARAGGRVDPADIGRVRDVIDEVLPLVAGGRRQPCHRDFTERNWQWDHHRLFVFDFGLARPDLGLGDVERLWSSSWRRDPGLADAFWDGYGRTLSSDDEAVLRAYGALQALSTVVWAVDHDDEPFEREGRNRLRWLLGGD